MRRFGLLLGASLAALGNAMEAIGFIAPTDDRTPTLVEEAANVAHRASVRRHERRLTRMFKQRLNGQTGYGTKEIGRYGKRGYAPGPLNNREARTHLPRVEAAPPPAALPKGRQPYVFAKVGGFAVPTQEYRDGLRILVHPDNGSLGLN